MSGVVSTVEFSLPPNLGTNSVTCLPQHVTGKRAFEHVLCSNPGYELGRLGG